MNTKVRIELDYNTRGNFHNASPIDLRVDLENTIEWNGDDLILLTDYQSRRIEKHFCGMSDCCCGAGPLIQVDNDKYAISKKVLA